MDFKNNHKSNKKNTTKKVLFILGILMLNLFVLVSSVNASCNADVDCNNDEFCNAGSCVSAICDDPNGDGLEEFKFDSGWVARDFVNSLGIYNHIPTQWNGAGALRKDTATIEKVCDLKGYPEVISYTGMDWHSPCDNVVGYWDESKNNFIIKSACHDNNLLNVLICGKVCRDRCDDSDSDGYDECSGSDDGDDGLPIDCNDNDDTVYPNADEICDGQDNDCDGIVDEASVNCGNGEVCVDGQCILQCVDNDNDGYDNCNPGNPGGDDGLPIDCNDNEGRDYPGAPELCDGKDNDCDGNIDENNGDCSNGEVCVDGQCIDNCVDNDNDGYDTCNPGQPGDDGNQVDCNDNNFFVNPGAYEVCDGIDNDCDGLVDENNGDCGTGEVCYNGNCVEIECSSNSDCGTDGFITAKWIINKSVSTTI